jgi:two-component system OmpR family response regulator
MKLLLVEDDRRAAGFVARGLNEAGYQVEHASEGHEGLEMALTRDYAAAVVDLMLPGLDGMSLIAEVRGRDIPLPIIILSAKGELNDRIKGLETGADDYLTKPFAFAELLARLQALLRRSSGQNEPTRLSIADLSLDLVSRNVSRGESPIDLQPKEFALFVNDGVILHQWSPFKEVNWAVEKSTTGCHFMVRTSFSCEGVEDVQGGVVRKGSQGLYC